MVAEENAEGKVKAVYDELGSVFGKVPGVMKALSPWPDVLELYSTRIGMIMLSETLLTCAVKEMVAALVSKINECDYCLTYHKSFMVDAGLTSPDAEAIPHDNKELLAYLKRLHAMPTKPPTTIWMGSRDVDCRKERSSKRVELWGYSAASITRVPLRR